MNRFSLTRRSTRIGALATVSAAGALVLAAAPALAAPGGVVKMDVTGATFECAGGVDYTVTSGNAIFMFQESSDANGGTHVTGTIAPSNVLLSSSTGGTYRLAGAGWFGFESNGVNGSYTTTDTEHFQIVGPGGVVARVSETFHITVASDGSVTAYVDKNSGTCSTPE
jgi:hypothetical protein